MRALVCTALEGEDALEVRDDWPAPGPCGPQQVRIAVGDRVLTLVGVGAFAEELLVRPPVQQVHVLPATMSFAHAAAFDLAYGTSGHALLQRGGLQPGETVLVTGAAGGCGSAAVQIAKAAGARVLAVVGGPDKAALATALGADEVLDHHTFHDERALSSGVAALTDGRGVDVVCDNVGGDVRDLVRCLGWNGRFLVVGFAAGEVPQLKLNLTVLRSISVIGIAYGASAILDPAANAALFARLFAWYEEGRLTPHLGGRHPLERGADAVRLLYDRAALGKIIIDLEST